MRQSIFWHCPSSFVWLLTPRSSFASTPSICTILIKISMDIADCPPSMRLTVLTLIPACSATFSCDKLISCLLSRIRLPSLIKSCDSARLPNMHLLPGLKSLLRTLRHRVAKFIICPASGMLQVSPGTLRHHVVKSGNKKTAIYQAVFTDFYSFYTYTACSCWFPNIRIIFCKAFLPVFFLSSQPLLQLLSPNIPLPLSISRQARSLRSRRPQAH